MNRDVDGITGIEGMGGGEGLSNHYFVVAARLGKPSGTEKEQIELLGPILRDRKDHSVRGFFHAGKVKDDRTRNPGLDRTDSRNLGKTCAERVWCSLQIAKHIGEAAA